MLEYGLFGAVLHRGRLLGWSWKLGLAAGAFRWPVGLREMAEMWLGSHELLLAAGTLCRTGQQSRGKCSTYCGGDGGGVLVANWAEVVALQVARAAAGQGRAEKQERERNRAWL